MNVSMSTVLRCTLMSAILNIMPFACEDPQKSNTTNSSNSHCDCMYVNSERLDVNLKEKIACNFRIAIKVEMGKKGPTT